MKREPQQTPLSTRENLFRDVKERSRKKRLPFQHTNATGLLNNEESPGSIGGMREEDRIYKTFSHHGS
jgi:hypothetical protein